MTADFFNGWPEDGEPVKPEPENKAGDLMNYDLDAARGIMHGVLAGLIMIVVVTVAVFIIASLVQAEEHTPYEPPMRDWYLP